MGGAAQPKEKAGEVAGARDEYEMDESGTWKQIVLLIGCVTVCHCRHIHLLGEGQPAAVL